MIPPFPIFELCRRCHGKATITEPDLPYEDLIMCKCPDCDTRGFVKKNKPIVVCLCGSTRFSGAFQQANLEETLAGKIVLSIGCDFKSDATLFARFGEYEREKIKDHLDVLHLHKIDLADEVLILNVDGYIGDSTRRELDYAKSQGKRIRYLEAHS